VLKIKKPNDNTIIEGDSSLIDHDSQIYKLNIIL